jgi:hypothetical protein
MRVAKPAGMREAKVASARKPAVVLHRTILALSATCVGAVAIVVFIIWVMSGFASLGEPRPQQASPSIILTTGQREFR